MADKFTFSICSLKNDISVIRTKSFFIALVVSAFFLFFTLNGKFNWNTVHMLVRGFSILEDSNSLSQIFVPVGKQYNSKEGIIYDCLTKDVHSRVAPVHHKTLLKSKKSGGEDPVARAKSFRDIFEKQIWIEDTRKTPKLQKSSSEFRASGWGSTLEETNYTISLLNSLVDRLKVKLGKQVITMVDVPCGDFFWMRHFVGKRKDVEYTGIDIVPELIKRHRSNYRNMSNARFEHFDIVSHGLDQSYDIVFCRELLPHLKNNDILKALEHFSVSGSKLLVTTNHIWNKSATELEFTVGRHRRLNLMLPPVNLVPPVCSTRDDTSRIFRELAIWSLPLKQRK